MDISILLLVLFLILSLAIYCILFHNPTPHIPAVSILEYLPGGLLNPVVKHPQNFNAAMHNLGRLYGRVFHSWFGARYTLVTSVPEDITHIMTSENMARSKNVVRVFSDISPGGIFSMPRPSHKALRRSMRDSFSMTMLRTFEERMNEAMLELCHTLHNMTDESVVDVTAVIARTTFRVITNVAFGSGMDAKEREQFARVTTQYFGEIMAEVLGYPFRQLLSWMGTRKRFLDCKHKIDEMCTVFITRRLAESKEQRETRKPDILDLFLELYPNDAQVVTSLVVEFALAGSHTTNQSLAWAIYEACCNQRVVKEIDHELERVLSGKPSDEVITFDELQQLPYIHKVWRETLRMHPISTVISRLCKADVTLKGSGVRVPKGRTVMAFPSALHVDPEIWSEPHVFKPERWGYGDVRGEGDRVPAGAYVPYGIGFRSCAGKFLAEYEGPLILAELFRRFRFELACRLEEVVTCSTFVDSPMYASKRKGEFDMGVPVRVEKKS